MIEIQHRADCTCATRGPRTCAVHRHFYNPLNVFDDRELVPGWHDTPDAAADRADQARADRGNR